MGVVEEDVSEEHAGIGGDTRQAAEGWQRFLRQTQGRRRAAVQSEIFTLMSAPRHITARHALGPESVRFRAAPPLLLHLKGITEKVCELAL